MLKQKCTHIFQNIRLEESTMSEFLEIVTLFSQLPIKYFFWSNNKLWKLPKFSLDFKSTFDYSASFLVLNIYGSIFQVSLWWGYEVWYYLISVQIYNIWYAFGGTWKKIWRFVFKKTGNLKRCLSSCIIFKQVNVFRWICALFSILSFSLVLSLVILAPSTST